MNRRKFLFGALAAGAAGQGGKEDKKEELRLAPHEVLIPTAEGRFILSLSSHGYEIGISAEVLAQVDAILLEIGPFRDPAILEDPKAVKWLGAVLRAARERRIPVFLIDSDPGMTQFDANQHWIVQILELLVGLGAIGYGLRPRDEEVESRRHLLGRWLSTLVGIYLVGPLFAEDVTRMSMPFQDGGQVVDSDATRANRAVREFNETTRLAALEPGYKSNRFRNAVMAHKALVVARLLEKESGKPLPTLPIFVGANHYGIADYLTMKEAEREKAIAENAGLFREVGPIVRLGFVQENGEEKVKVTVIEETDWPAQPE